LARLGEEEVSLRAAANSLKSENFNVRFFAAEALRLNRSKKVVPLVMRQLVSEFNRSGGKLHPRFIDRHPSERVFTGLLTILEERTGQRFGRDVTKWNQWWEGAKLQYDSV
jgi:hypothetical protein